LLGNKPFLVLAHHLTKNGIALLRYDDRGVGRSKGSFGKATSADFATDVNAAVQYLKTRKEIDVKKIGLIGHSEGGMIAPMVAAESKDIGFIVLLAGTGVPGKDIIILQQQLIAKAEGGASEKDLAETAAFTEEIAKIVTSGKDEKTVSTEFIDFLKSTWQKLPDSSKQVYGTEAVFLMQSSQMNTPWMRYFLSYDPASALQKVRIPVLALNGSKDLQVWPTQNLPAIEKALKNAGNKKYTVKELPGLNHLFQECTTGAPSEYEKIEMTMAPGVLELVTTWIREQTKM
jgi:hypothetical protein